MKFWNRKKDDVDSVLHRVETELNKIQVNNEQEAVSLRAALASMISGTYDGSDTLHNIYCDFGYPLQITFAQFWNMYRRFGIAKNVVELPVNITWLTNPEIESTEAFTRNLETLITEKNLWQRLKGLDTRQRVGRYAGLFMRVNDGLEPSEPLTEKSIGLNGLIDIIPLYEGQLDVLNVNQDVMSIDYGKPTMYQLLAGSAGNRNENVSKSVNIHPSRLVMAAEGADDGNIYGVPSLEACYNSLMDLRKIIGASGEGFYRNAVQSVVFELMDMAKASTNKQALDDFTTAFDDWIKNRARRGIMSPGMKPHLLSATLASPKDHFASAINDVAASSQIPATILIGQQTGRLASNEDSRAFLATINSRRENYGSELITNTLDWLIEYGILPAAEYKIVWDDLLALSDQEKLDNAFKMADVNNKQTGIGGEIIFTGDEIRVAAGFEPFDEIDSGDEELDEELDIDEEIADGEENES